MVPRTTRPISTWCFSRRTLARFSSAPACNKQLSGEHIPLPSVQLDYGQILDDRQAYLQNLANRHCPVDPSVLEDLQYCYSKARALENRLKQAKARQRSLGEKIRQAKVQQVGHLDERSPDRAEATALKQAVTALSQDAAALEQRLLESTLQLPNFTYPGTPVGGYDACKLIDSFGLETATADPNAIDREPQPQVERDHLSILTALGWLSFQRGHNTSGSSFPFLLGPAACLELALSRYALAQAMAKGWKFVIPPDMVKTEVARRCGFAPRDTSEANQTYYVNTAKLQDEEVSLRCLAGTAEIPLTASYHSSLFPDKNHPGFPREPIRIIGIGHAFRAEAGARGQESRGLYRVHQFTKVELVAMTGGSLSESDRMLHEMVDLQRLILQGLGLPCRVLEMSTQELGATAYRKIDIEAWMPGRGVWGEVTSASNCTDYQSRRLGIRYRKTSSSAAQAAPINRHTGRAENIDFVHSLNATAAAIPRLIVALVENGAWFGPDGKIAGVRLPRVLKSHWLGDDDSGKICWT